MNEELLEIIEPIGFIPMGTSPGSKIQIISMSDTEVEYWYDCATPDRVIHKSLIYEELKEGKWVDRYFKGKFGYNYSLTLIQKP